MSVASKKQRLFRFPPAQLNTTVTLRASGGQGGTCRRAVGIVMDESRGGFGAIFVDHELSVGQVWLAELTRGPRELAAVRWVSELAPRIYRVGFEYTG